ncbi:uncharacterized protein LOC129253377 [Anastrepha obliqua]|uniref:uncharacterized protein LOC129253377 n=1 Tax=Anastrepha obliqua TaxID=95512 RepID=UPI002409F147|nr:uncharacterized protein LOC129253377 [Anastrepha obliqua]
MEYLHLEKLNHLNYRYWVTMVRAYLEKEDLWDTIERSNPAENTLLKERQARFIILFLVEPGIVRDIPYNIRSAKEMWIYFSQRFTSRKSREV